ncbi:MAG: hypothetical protein RSF84_00400 [Ruthenibacterium sp.]
MPENQNNLNFLGDVAPNSEQNLFHSEMFGFKRDEVLACIERMTEENMEKVQSLEKTIAELKERLFNAERDNDTLLRKTKEVCAELASEHTRAETALAQINSLRAEIDKANDSLTQVRSQLAAKEQEAISLKADNARLNSTVNSLTANMADYENNKDALEQKALMVRAEAEDTLAAAKQRADASRRESEAQAMIIRAKAEDEARIITAQARQQKTDTKKMITDSADNIAASIVVLKAQLSAVDEKILAATGNLQKATGCISAALGNTEKDLVMLGVQMEKFPTPIPPVTPTQPLHSAPRMQQPEMQQMPQPEMPRMQQPEMSQTPWMQQPVMPQPAPVLNYTQNPAQQDKIHAQQRAAYTQNYDAYDEQRLAYEAHQRMEYERQQQAAYYAQQQREAYEAEQRAAYARMQQEQYDRQMQEAYDRQMQQAFEKRQHEMYEKMQREAYEKQQREAFEQQQRADYDRQMREVYEAQQRAAYERTQREAHAQQTTGVYGQPVAYGQPHFPQPMPFAPFPQSAPATYTQPTYAPPVYQTPPQASNIASNYVPRPAPIAAGPVESYSEPPMPIQQEADALNTVGTQTMPPYTQPQATPYQQAAQYAPYQAPAVPASQPVRPAQTQTPPMQPPYVPAPETPLTPVPPQPAPIAPAPLAQQNVPFAQQQAFSAPKGTPPITAAQQKRTVQPRRNPNARSRANLSDALIDGLSNLMNK